MTRNYKSKKLWQTGPAAATHPLVEAYTVGTDYLSDQKLLGYDITATKAHVRMLESVGLLNGTECGELIRALDLLHAEWSAGRFRIGPDQEDGHTAIEVYLTGKLGPAGKKVHTGRSRNDQALVMMRLYLKDGLTRVRTLAKDLSSAYGSAALKAGTVPMPGYTHGRKAMPTAAATWLGSFGDAFGDAGMALDAARELVDRNPLGSAAGFGVSLPLDRSLTTEELGFKKVQDNPMYCGLSRGLFELAAVQALAPLMLLAGKFAQDMMLFTSQEFGFFSLPDELTTGSSIMPQKKNYDLFEVMRGQANAFGGYVQQLYAVAGGNGSGYNRDLQLTKGVTMTAFDAVESTLEVLALAVSRLRINEKALKAAMTDDLMAVSRIDELVLQGVPFRDAYAQVKKALAGRK